ncbi:MAG: DUF1846 domain-containing protein [Candidatus Omnitrophica bacterium]|nr:DUF1846 domain-containing protein [Candidatus Omnitrophota bacterium]MBU1997346.1 DUF1846 domain-containing protein [Candidatus Omnitrophota bacterium]MBU4333120.1 DUF1846 domain-containing protein [Candidatus Omnitrophota bacterium]
MVKKTGFDNEKYLKEQTEAILKRVDQFDDKLYLEFGGKLLYDYHASRVLPGFDPNVKMRLLKQLKDKSDIILCIYAGDIERKKIRADFGITYDMDAFKLIDDLKDWEINICAVVITRYENQPSANVFKNKLERQDIRVYTHSFTKGYPTDVDLIVSDQGYGANDYIETKNKLVVVTAPGPGSGKLATCLSQLYHEHKRGVNAGYAKFETFPIWNLPLKHPVNIAYESATADLRDYNMLDSFHLEKHNVKSVNYNRDMEVFPVLKRILEKIMGESMYSSPTDMGVNCASFGIVDDEVVQAAAKQEIIRRYFRSKYEYAMGLVDKDAVQRCELLIEEIGVKSYDRTVVQPARDVAKDSEEKGLGNKGVYCGAAIELQDGTIITGKNSPLMHAASSLILNVLKHLAEIPDKIPLLSENIIHFISKLKRDILELNTISLNLDETLISLSISAATNPAAKMALEKLKEIRGCEVHMTHIPTSGDEVGLRCLGVNLTTDPNFSSKSFYEVA